MKNFRYRLQAVQDLRERHEREAGEKYATTLALRANALQHLETAERELTAGQGEYQRLLGTGASAADIRQRQLFCQWLQERRDSTASELATAEVKVNQALGELMQSRRNVEAIQKHHDKAKDNHAREQQAEEQRWLDDLTLRNAPGLLS